MRRNSNINSLIRSWSFSTLRMRRVQPVPPRNVLNPIGSAPEGGFCFLIFQKARLRMAHYGQNALQGASPWYNGFLRQILYKIGGIDWDLLNEISCLHSHFKIILLMTMANKIVDFLINLFLKSMLYIKTFINKEEWEKKKTKFT